MKFVVSALLLFSTIAASAATLLPTPQQVQQASKKIVITEPCLITGAKENPLAAASLKTVLKNAGIQKIKETGTAATTFALGSSAAAKICPEESRTLKTLSSEGYLLRIRKADKQTQIILAGGEERGTFYAVQTLRQMLEEGRTLKQIRILDKPDYARRGVVEGFYGSPWTHQDRLSILRFMGENKLNTYIYAPKDDPYHREKWIEDYPPEQMKRMKELAQTARESFVNFTFAISPGGSISYSSEKDFNALCTKMDHVRALGIDHFALFLDDIALDMQYQADKDRFKGLGEAQAYLVNRLYKHLISRNPKATLVLCPTYYYIVEPNEYVKQLGAATDPRVPIMWTGNGVTSKLLLSTDADTYGSGLQRKPFVWDNYPVNDYSRNTLLMGPIRGRNAELAKHLSGLVSNPMNEAEASKIALYTYADYLWNSKAYTPDKSWDTALRKLAGPKGYPYFKLFAEQTKASFLGDKDSEELQKLIRAYQVNPCDKTRAPLETLLTRFVQLQKDLDRTIANKKLLSEIKPYVEKLSRYGVAGQAALDLASSKDQDISKLWTQWLEYKKMKDSVNQIKQSICGGVMEQLLTNVTFSSSPALGISGYTVSASFSPWQENVIEYMLDKNPKSFFWGGQSAKAGDWVTIDLGTPKPVDKIQLLMGAEGHGDDWIHQGELQYSQDMKTWTTLKEVKNPEVTWEGAVIPMRAVRVLASAPQEWWVIIREFDVHVQTDTTSQSNLIAAQDSDLSWVCDGNQWSAFQSASAVKKGDWVQIDLGANTPEIKKVTILMNQYAYLSSARIERSEDGINWTEIGKSNQSVFQAKFEPVKARFVRITADEDQASPVGIYEISVEK